MQATRAVLVILLALAVSMLLQLVVVGRFQHAAAQERARDQLRGELARGVAPIGPAESASTPVGTDGAERTERALAIGTPVALIEIPEIGLEEVIVEGTTPGALLDGPGHRRDTPLPGQVGTSIVMGRRAAFGGPFGGIRRLDAGDDIRVTTGQGVFVFEVIGVRREGDPVPPPLEPGGARLVLATADGRAFVPDGVLRVDADLQGDAVGGPARVYTADSLPDAERFMGTDTSTLWAFALWLQALIALAIGAVWSWHRWGRAQTWVVFLPPILLVGLAVSGEAVRLLPNLM